MTFSCRSRSELSGPLSVSCLEDGTWSNDAPVCILGEKLSRACETLDWERYDLEDVRGSGVVWI